MRTGQEHRPDGVARPERAEGLPGWFAGVGPSSNVSTTHPAQVAASADSTALPGAVAPPVSAATVSTTTVERNGNAFGAQGPGATVISESGRSPGGYATSGLVASASAATAAS